MSTTTARPDHEIVVIGAGLTGIGTASALLRAGIDDFVIVDRAHDVGGTWRDNTYPGVGVDVPSFTYQFLWETKADWSRIFGKGDEVKQYIDDYIAKYRIRPHLRLGVDVLRRTWDEEAHLWRLATADGAEITARFVFTAQGSFLGSRPVTIAGVDDFGGHYLIPMAWDHDYDLTGKRVAVIGTGASAVQIVPAIAGEVAALDVYQRTPIWIVPKPDPVVPPWAVKLLERPQIARAAYALTAKATELTLAQAITRYAVSRPLHWAFEKLCRWELSRSVDDPDTRRRLTPDYRFGCKRPSMSNSYFKAYNRANVTLITDPISTITAGGIRTIDTVERDYDAIVLATGYVMAWDPAAWIDRPVTGARGFDLSRHLAEHRVKAYEGVSLPGLPNYFMSYSAYSGLSSWHPIVQVASKHLVRVVSECRRRGATRVEITETALDRYHSMVDRRMATAIFFHQDCSGAHSYYIDQHGDAPTLRPTSTKRAVKASGTFPLDDYAYASLPDGAATRRVTAVTDAAWARPNGVTAPVASGSGRRPAAVHFEIGARDKD